MSSLTILILLIAFLTFFGTGLYLWWIKEYYWTKRQKEKRRQAGKTDWLS